MSRFTLYGYWRSSCSWRVRIALHLKGIDFENLSVHLVKDGGQQHKADYLALNPMGQVPCLVDHQAGLSLTQSAIILDYLEEQVPEPALYPGDAGHNRRIREFCTLINTGIQPLQNLAVLQQIEGRFGADAPAKAAWAAHFIARGFTAAETMLKDVGGDFCFGDRVTMADLFLIPQIFGAHRFGVDMTAFPTLARIDAHCGDLDAFVKAAPGAQPDAQS